MDDEELKAAMPSRQPYGEWLDRHLVYLRTCPSPTGGFPNHSQAQRDQLQKAFGYTYEEVKDAICPWPKRPGAHLRHGRGHPAGGADPKHQPLFSYFKQLFAQVTNPPWTPSGRRSSPTPPCTSGSGGNLLEEQENCTVLQIHNPILTYMDLMKIRYMNQPGFQVETILLLYYKSLPL